MRLLLVEDSLSLRRSISTALSRTGWAVDCCDNGRDGLALALRGEYDVVILDIMLPDLDGWQVLQRLRGSGGHVPIMMLTARDSIDDRVRGLSEGADDYLIKPFSLNELEARLLALVRRAHGQAKPIIAVGSLGIDLARKRVTIGERSLNLPRREFQLLELLALHIGTVVSRDHIITRLWPDEVDISANAVEAAVSALRRSLESIGCEPLIHTRRGLGYILGVGV